MPDGRFVGGRFVGVDVGSLGVAFVPRVAGELALLGEGQAYRRFDGYWGKRAALVLDRRRQWVERRFEPVDAVAYGRAGGGTLVGKVTNQEWPEGGTLIKGGRDHEHCEVCSATISPKADPVAMFSGPDHWICRECYEGFVVPRSLGFIYVGDSDRVVGEE